MCPRPRYVPVSVTYVHFFFALVFERNRVVLHTLYLVKATICVDRRLYYIASLNSIHLLLILPSDNVVCLYVRLTQR